MAAYEILSLYVFFFGRGGGAFKKRFEHIYFWKESSLHEIQKKMHEIMICVVPSAATKSLSRFLSRAVHTANIEIKQCVKCSHARG